MTVPCFLIMRVARHIFMCMLMAVTVNMTMFINVFMLMVMHVTVVVLMFMHVIVVMLVLMVMDMLMSVLIPVPEVLHVIVVVIVLMVMDILMSVLIPVPVGMLMPVYIFISIVSNHTDSCACDAVTLVPRYLQSPSLHIQLLQAALQHLTADSQVKHRPQVHVSADSGKAVIIQYLHSVFSFFNTSSAGRTVAYVRILRLLI